MSTVHINNTFFFPSCIIMLLCHCTIYLSYYYLIKYALLEKSISDTDLLFKGVDIAMKRFKFSIHNPLRFHVHQLVQKQGTINHNLVIARVLRAKCSYQNIKCFY